MLGYLRIPHTIWVQGLPGIWGLPTPKCHAGAITAFVNLASAQLANAVSSPLLYFRNSRAQKMPSDPDNAAQTTPLLGTRSRPPSTSGPGMMIGNAIR